MYLLDTNILLKYPSALNSFEPIYLSIRVIEELDKLKRSLNEEIAYEARRAAHKILQHDSINYVLERNDKISVDDDLIRIAKKHNYILVSNDLNVQIKCRAKRIKYQNYDKIATTYTGIQYLILPFDDNYQNEELTKMLNEDYNIDSYVENEYVIIKNANEFVETKNGLENTVVCELVKVDGHFKVVDEKIIKNKFSGKNIKARNTEQRCLMDLLFNEAITILFASGEFGVGKTFLLANYAYSQVEKGAINKIVYVPNNSFNADSREIGYLPGDLIDKEIIHMGSIVDIFGEEKIRMMIENGTLEVVPISIMRGRNFENSIVLVNEAQNLTTDHIKLLIGRCGDKTRIFFDGDIKQTDGLNFKNKNGLKLLIHLKDSPIYSKMFGTVRMKSIERSVTAQASEYLDKLLI